jgi:CheY-like chemotaxis protein
MVALALWRYKGTKSVDTTVIALVIAAVLIHLVPIQRITTFKGAGVEFSVEQPQVKGAIDALTPNQVQNEELRKDLERLRDDLPLVRGSRVLWIDNSPDVIVAARRLLRALGVEIVPAVSSEMADEILARDKDFDLIVTDTQRPGNSYKFNNGIEIHEGVNYLVKLRKTADPIVKQIPVIFFSAYDWDRLVMFTRPARETLPEPEITNSVNDLILKVVKRLAHERSRPLVYDDQKEPTPVEGNAQPRAPGDAPQAAGP